MVILSNIDVAWTKFEQGTDMSRQMKDLIVSRENNCIIRTCTKQLHIKNKLNPYSKEKNIFPNNVYYCYYKLLNTLSLLI